MTNVTLPILPSPRVRRSALPLPLFQRLVQREKARVERGGTCFSILEVGLGDAPEWGQGKARRAIAARIRDGDDLTYTDDSRVFVLLPETRGEGARVLVRDLRRVQALGGEEVSIAVYEFDGRSILEDPGALPRLLPGDSVQRLEPHFVAAVPRWKRALDMGVAGVALLLLLPIFLVLTLAICIESRGGPFYPQVRVARGGRLFRMWKFRSMVAGADSIKEELGDRNEQEGPIFKMKQDPRVTTVGRFLRRTSLDELPQLWNVLRGDMTLVGPRPPVPEEVREYLPWQARRLDEAMGLTCIWQTSGRSEVPFVEWMRMDRRYGRSKGLWVDLRLLAKTVGAVLKGRGAY